MEKVPGADQQTRRAQAGSQPQGATERDARRRARGRKSKQFGVRLKLCQTNCLLFSGESGVWRTAAIFVVTVNPTQTLHRPCALLQKGQLYIYSPG